MKVSEWAIEMFVCCVSSMAEGDTIIGNKHFIYSGDLGLST